MFHGLARRQVGRSDLTAHSVAVVAPSLSALGSGLMLPVIVGPGWWVSTFLGFGLAWLLALTFGQFASRFTAAGSLYTYVAKGLGPTLAMLVAVSMVVGYGVLVMFGLTGAVRRAEASWEAFGGGPLGAPVEWAVLLAGAAACVAMMRLGIAWSTRAALAAEAVTVGLLVLIMLVWTARYGVPDLSAFSLTGADPARIIPGAALITLVTVAFESSATLGVEAARPFHSVASSMRITILLAGGLYFLANIVGTVIPTGVERVHWRWFAPYDAASPLDGIALLVLAASLLALALCAWTALSRLLFSFAREGTLWPVLGRTSPSGVPTVAMWSILAPVLGVPAVATLLGARLGDLSSDLLQAATVIMCVAYGLAALSVLPFLHSLDELRTGPAVVALCAFAGVAAVAVHRVRMDAGAGTHLAPMLLAGVVVVGLGWRLVVAVAHPHLVDRVGTHEEPLVSDVLVPAGAEDPGHGRP